MAQHPQAAPQAPRLYLVTPTVAEPAAITDALVGALSAADVAAVLVRLAPADERTLINRIKALAPVVQATGVALIVEGHPEIVARAGADGCHLTDVTGLQSAAPVIKPTRILGAGGLTTRHDAMTAGEVGVDYVMFGEPDAVGVRPSFSAIHERVAWWAEVFEIPCVAFAGHLDEVADLSSAGADFIALGEAVFSDPRGLTAAVADAGQRMMLRAPA
jgi:thiamine-phosphate pyrophosphorylase